MKTEFKTAADLLAYFKGRATHMPLQHCPRCSGRLDRVDGSGLPEPGGLVLCCHCEAPCTITDDLHLRLMSDAEVAALPEFLLLDLLDAIENSRTIKKARKERDRLEREAAVLEWSARKKLEADNAMRGE